ncbi:MAG: DNA cytosine methyltransferase [Verrucomicrobiota bacterium]
MFLLALGGRVVAGQINAMTTLKHSFRLRSATRFMWIASFLAARFALRVSQIVMLAQSGNSALITDNEMSRRAKPKIIDLFAGVGGFSLGAVRAGFELAAAVDLDRHAVDAHQKNFPHAAHARRDIFGLCGDDIRDLAKLNGHRLTGLIGGPPCQGFSTMGRMRKNDARNKLFFHFFRLISELNPLFFVCENVPGILDEKYETLREESFKVVKRKYHMLDPFELSAGDFGAATERSRVFFVGWAKDAGIGLSLGYFTPSPRVKKVTVRSAFAGLPKRIDPNWQTEESGWRRVDLTESDFTDTINKLVPGVVGDKTALDRFAQHSEVSGFLGTIHTRKVIARFAEVEPGKMDSVSKFPRLKWDALCPTLRAGTAKDRGSYQAARPIHPSQDRVITPREAARLQGFPDWFLFHQTKWHSFRQIGNSIPPLLAEGILRLLAGAASS